MSAASVTHTQIGSFQSVLCVCLNWTLINVSLFKVIIYKCVRLFATNVKCIHFYPFIDLFTRSFIHLVSHLSSFIRPLHHSLTFIHSLAHSLCRLLIHSFIHLPRSVSPFSRFKTVWFIKFLSTVQKNFNVCFDGLVTCTFTINIYFKYLHTCMCVCMRVRANASIFYIWTCLNKICIDCWCMGRRTINKHYYYC